MQEMISVVSLSTLLRNASLVKERAGVPLIAVVKDDAYGHGAERVAHALDPIAALFAVSTVREGAALRVSGVQKDILTLTPALTEEEVLRAARYGLLLTVSSRASLLLSARAAEKFGTPVRAHLAVNTGMNRYGFRPSQLAAACREAEERGVCVEGAYSHFYLPEDEKTRETQYGCFFKAAQTVKERFPRALCHLSATGGILAGARYRFDAARSGIALYGYLPNGFEGRLPVRPAAKFYAAVAHRGRPFGEGAGYQKAERPYLRLHTLRLGYGDGFFRAGGPGVGRLCMDACVCEGDAPFGARRRAIENLETYAKNHNTTVYELLVRLGAKSEKIYV